MPDKKFEVWHDGERYYVKLPEGEQFVPSYHEQWLRPHFDITSDSVVADIGAHVGSHTLWLARRCRSVLAFEPHPLSRRLLTWNLALNDCHNVTVFPIGLYDGAGTATMDDSGGGSKLGSPGNSTVVFDRLDNLALEWPQLDFVKIDCEGAEAKVLRGARQTIKRLRPKLVIESHHLYDFPGSDTLLQETESELRELGYEWQALLFQEYKMAYYIKAWPRPHH